MDSNALADDARCSPDKIAFSFNPYLQLGGDFEGALQSSNGFVELLQLPQRFPPNLEGGGPSKGMLLL